MILTDTDRSIIAGLYKAGCNWVARDKNDKLYGFFALDCPIKKGSCWINKDINTFIKVIFIEGNYLSFVSWDKPPYNIGQLYYQSVLKQKNS